MSSQYMNFSTLSKITFTVRFCSALGVSFGRRIDCDDNHPGLQSFSLGVEITVFSYDANYARIFRIEDDVI